MAQPAQEVIERLDVPPLFSLGHLPLEGFEKLSLEGQKPAVHFVLQKVCCFPDLIAQVEKWVPGGALSLSRLFFPGPQW